jgi:hypothetical protein
MSTHETPGDAHPTGVASLNLGLSDELKTSFSNIVAIKRPLIKNQEIDLRWISPGGRNLRSLLIRGDLLVARLVLSEGRFTYINLKQI